MIVITVSIHAPARGATNNLLQRISQRLRFNPRTRTGCDISDAGITNLFFMFQSTHPHGVRLVTISTFLLIICVSIHAPARGATSDFEFTIRVGPVSIHAPARGATSQKELTVCCEIRFNPRTRTGCDI